MELRSRWKVIQKGINIVKHIETVDALMGRGKTFATLRYIEQQAMDNTETRWIYCTEYLNEITKRTGKDSTSLCKHLWRTPLDSEKTEKLIELLLEPKVQLIAITHALLILVSKNPYINSLFKVKGYSLFLDETIELITPYTGVKQGDFFLWKKEDKLKLVGDKGKIEWTYDNPLSDNLSFTFDSFVDLAKTGVLHCSITEPATTGSQGRLSIVEVHNEVIFTQFKRVILASYQLEHTLFSAYCELKSIPLVPCLDIVCRNESTKENIRSLITLNNKYNEKFKGKTLSSSWWKAIPKIKDGTDAVVKDTSKVCSKEDIKLVNNTIRSIGDSSGCKGNANLLGFTVPAIKIGKSTEPMKVYPRGYPHTVCYINTTTDSEGNEQKEPTTETNKSESTYIPCNARASEDYKNKNVMIHAYNRYPLVPVSSYLSAVGIPFSHERFALNELLQWLWRSAIREDKPIIVAILSERMRNIFVKWLDD